MSAPPLSVISICAGRRSHLRRLVEGMERSPIAGRLELVVVLMDESDLDADSDVVDLVTVPFGARVDGLPLAAARNLGAARARSERLLFLDVDCIPSAALPGAAARHEREEIAMAPVGYLPAGVPQDGWTEAQLERATSWLPGRPRAPEAGAEVEPRLFWSLAFAVGRRTLLDRVGGFDESYVGYGAEDTDLGLRAARAGVPVTWLGCSCAFHQHHGSLSPPADQLTAIVANSRRFHRRWGFWPMEGWLREFERHGWISWEPQAARLDLLRLPEPEELDPLRTG